MIEFVQIRLKDVEENKKFIARSLQGVRIWRDKWKRIRKERYDSLKPFHNLILLREEEIVTTQDVDSFTEEINSKYSTDENKVNEDFSSIPVDYTKMKKAELIEYIITNNIVEMEEKELSSFKKIELITLIEEKS